ncbi:hypothetical protein TAF16_1474 [Anoxybacillus flavithermus]|uniref:Uncharacterized protein n=1 Tax=Anoxybacillus flavithermus TaxID=33934 RepID=A0A178TEA8_9BACL|nr:hypothetical protein TAF16_1474 [Anoxybacillus flavithermus]
MLNPFLDYTKKSMKYETKNAACKTNSFFSSLTFAHRFLVRHAFCRFPGKFTEKKAMLEHIAPIVPYVF